jgi:predicted nucleotidyltransferase
MYAAHIEPLHRRILGTASRVFKTQPHRSLLWPDRSVLRQSFLFSPRQMPKEGIMNGHKAGMDIYPRRLTAPLATALCLSLIAVAIAAICVHGVRADEAAILFRISSHDPTAHEVGVGTTADIQATFDDDVNGGTLTNGTFVVHGHLGGLASGAFSYDGPSRTVTLDPSREFHAGEVLRVSATDGILNTSAQGLEPYGWQFTVSPVRDRSFAGFVEIDAGLQNVYDSSAAWGDVDNDGDLDILLAGAGASETEVYRNDGGGVFTDIGSGLPGVVQSSVAWGDYDNDGDLDVLLAGYAGTTRVSELHRNDGAGGFVHISAGLVGVHFGSVAWGDVDNDGDLDILLTGWMGTGPASAVYRNHGGGAFTDIGVGLMAVGYSSGAWGDYDNDGDLDVLLAGYDTGRVSKVYRNDGPSGFADIGAGLTGVDESAVAWGDYDNDGDLDILLTGDTGSGKVSLVYRNDGGGVFSNIGAALTAVDRSSVAWGDYDNDGDLDILLAGSDTADNPVSTVYRNDGGGAFADVGAGLTGVSYGSVAWGDYDDDSDLDILLTGWNGSSATSKVYLNNSKPSIDRVVPDAGSGPVGVTTYFTTTWSDRDGPGDLKQCYFHIGDSPALAGNVTLMYNAAKNKLWLLDDSGTTWTGGYAPGDVEPMDNSQVRVYCYYTEVWRRGNRVEVAWAIRFKSGFEGAKKLGLKARDIYKARAKAKWKGTWTVKP